MIKYKTGFDYVFVSYVSVRIVVATYKFVHVVVDDDDDDVAVK